MPPFVLKTPAVKQVSELTQAKKKKKEMKTVQVEQIICEILFSSSVDLMTKNVFPFCSSAI